MLEQFYCNLPRGQDSFSFTRTCVVAGRLGRKPAGYTWSNPHGHHQLPLLPGHHQGDLHWSPPRDGLLDHHRGGLHWSDPAPLQHGLLAHPFGSVHWSLQDLLLILLCPDLFVCPTKRKRRLCPSYTLFEEALSNSKKLATVLTALSTSL